MSPGQHNVANKVIFHEILIMNIYKSHQYVLQPCNFQQDCRNNDYHMPVSGHIKSISVNSKLSVVTRQLLDLPTCCCTDDLQDTKYFMELVCSVPAEPLPMQILALAHNAGKANQVTSCRTTVAYAHCGPSLLQSRLLTAP